MKKEENKITPKELFDKISDYFEIINTNSILKESFVEFDKYYRGFTNNKGVLNALSQKKQSQSINQNKDTIDEQDKEIKYNETLLNNLKEEIGTKETEDEEATGLYKEIFDLKEKIGLPAIANNEPTGLYKDWQDTKDKLSENIKELDKTIKELDKTIKEKNDEVANVKDLSELKKENKRHIKLHFVVSTIVSIALLIIICYVIFGVFGNTEKYINFASKDLTSLEMLSSAFSFLLIKIPFAIVFGIILGGGYSVLRSCVNHYENIHKEIRDISSIYAITGRMSIESILILGKIKEFSTEEDEDKLTDFLTISNREDREHLKEKLKWHEIVKYLSSRGESNIAKNQELKTSATSIPSNLIQLLNQVTKIIKALK